MSVDNQTSIKHKISAEQIRIMHSSIPVLLLANVFVVLALSYGFSDVVAHSSIKICLGLLLVMVLGRGGLYLYYKDKFDPQNLRPFALSLIIGSAIAGGLWATLSILYLPADDQTFQLFLLLSLMAMAGGSAFTFSIYLPSYFAYIPATLLPITLQFFSMGEKFYNTLGTVSAVYLLVLTVFNIKINKNFKATLALRFENLELIEQLKLQKEEAERANQSKSKFLSAASHDLRQPLYALGLFTTVLDETITSSKAKKVVEKITASVHALTHLFDKLLDISQLDAGVISVNKQDFSLKTIFNKLALEFDNQAQAAQNSINWPTEYPSVYSEPDLLEQILRNYLSNAIKYTQQGSVSVECEVHNHMVTIKVIDTGVGMTELDIADIYQEFHQIDNPERDRAKGLGLGLSIVKRTAELLGHKIAVESLVGQGSTFSILVTEAEHVVVEPTTALHDEENVTPDNKLIVVIDDEEDIREGLNSVLTLWDYKVITAEEPQSALQQLQVLERKPDVIISDYRLRGGKTGVEAIESIHSVFGKDIPALLITGDIESERLVEMKMSGFQILFKPVPTMKLRAFLRNVNSQ